MTAPTDLICYLYGVGAWGPGFASWMELRQQLLDPSLIPTELTVPPAKAEVIPGNERRRAPPVVRAAVEVSTQACQAAAIAPVDMACVFGSGLGDTEITDYLCTQLATAEKQLSPTRFHNSVHNAPAGYWTIATHSMRAANSIAAYQHTAGISLLEAAAQSTQESLPVLVTLYDLVARGLYADVFSTDREFAAALALTPAPLERPPMAKLTFSVVSSALADPAWAPTFAHLALHNPAARVLPLLYAIADSAPAACATVELADHLYLNILVEK